MIRIALVSCVKSKRPDPACAGELYDSVLFRESIEFARRWGADKIFILSAEYGLVEQSEVIAPYEKTLNHMRVNERKVWACRVGQQLSERADLANDEFLVLAGARYAEFLLPILNRVEDPLKGMPLGKRVQFLQSANRADGSRPLIQQSESACGALHSGVHGLPRFRYPFRDADLPRKGLYMMFENGECGHSGDRIVRIGTHTGKRTHLADRLSEHFDNENKDRSIFRKQIGRALLNREGDPYFDVWDIDFTSRAKREQYGHRLDAAHQEMIEQRVTAFMRENISIAVLGGEESATERGQLEKCLIGTVANCHECGPSKSWVGRNSPDTRIAESGLWQVQHLKADALALDSVVELFG